MVRKEVIEFIRSCKGRYTDEEIRQQLLKDGVPGFEIEEAFQIAGAIAPPPPAPRKGSLLPLVFFFLAVATIGVVVVMKKASRIGGASDVKAACELGVDENAEVEAAIKSHSPGAYAYPSNIDAFLPTDTEEGDGAGYMLMGVQAALEKGGTEMVAGLGTKGYRLPAPVLEAAAPSIEKALKYTDYQMTGARIVPAAYPEAGIVGIVPIIIEKFAASHLDLSARYLKEDKLLEAEGEAKKAIAMGMMMMKDWANVSQAMGAAVIMDGYAALTRVHRILIDRNPGLDCVVRKMEIAKVSGMLGKEIAGYMPQPQETKAMAEVLADPKRLPELQRFLDSASLRQHYAELVLLGVMEAWSPAEILAGKPQPGRRAFLEAAARHKDARLAGLAAGYVKAFDEVQGIYANLPPGDRKLAAEGKPAPSMAALVDASPAGRLKLLTGLINRSLVPR